MINAFPIHHHQNSLHAAEFDFKSKLFAERAIEKKGRKSRAERNFLFACPKVCFKERPGNRETVSFRLSVPPPLSLVHFRLAIKSRD